MPTYTFKNNKTGEIFDKVMKIAEKEPYLKDNPDLSSVFNETNFVGDHIVKKIDDVISFAKETKKLIVITRGEKGAIAINKNEIEECSAKKNLQIIDLTLNNIFI